MVSVTAPKTGMPIGNAEAGFYPPDITISNLAWPQYANLREDSLFVLPIGALEPHGAHMPLATDSVVASFMAREVQGAGLRVAILPTLLYGHKTSPMAMGGLMPGGISLRSETLRAVIGDVLDACYREGVRRFLILNAHIANVPVIFEAVDAFCNTASDATVMAASWWDFVTEGTRDAIAEATGVPRTHDHHAALAETSLLLHLAPELVAETEISDDCSTRRVDYLILPFPDRSATRTGTVFRARGATADIGEELWTEMSANLLRAIRIEFGAVSASDPEKVG